MIYNKKYGWLRSRMVFYCNDCLHCVRHECGVKICDLKVKSGWDCVGIHTAGDGTALNCPRY